MTILQLKMLNSLKSKLSLVTTIFCAIRICKKLNSNKQTKQNIFSFLHNVLIRITNNGDLRQLLLVT